MEGEKTYHIIGGQMESMEGEKTYHINGDHFPSPIGEARRDHAYFKDLKKRLRWQLLGVYITPLVLLSVYVYFYYQSTLKVGVHNHLKSVAENQRNTVDLFLQERVSNIRNLFLTCRVHSSISSTEMKNILQSLFRKSKAFADLGLFQADGKLVAYSGPFPSLEGKSYREESWFKAVLATESDYFISDVYLGFRSHPHFIIAVRQEIDGVSWVFRASVDPDEFGAFVGRSYLVKEAETFIVNHEGKRQTRTALWKTAPRFPLPRTHTKETSIVEQSTDGGAFVSAVANLSHTKWSLVVRVPTEKAYALMRRARAIFFGAIPVIIGVIVIVVFRSTHRMIVRLENVTAAKETLQRQLFNAAKLASIGEIAAGVAHEINNPLAIIYEEAAMMKDTLDPAFDLVFSKTDFVERLSAIEDATIRGRTITRKLLAFAREYDETPTLIDINKMVQRVIKTRQTSFRLANIEIIEQLADNVGSVASSAGELDQIMLNLLNNAKDAIVGEGTVTIRTYKEQRYVCIDVADTGVGMPMEVMEKVFFPFFTTKEAGKGTGLGLSISYGIVKSLGGRIEIQSAPGKGTKITIQLPIPKHPKLKAPLSARTSPLVEAKRGTA